MSKAAKQSIFILIALLIAALIFAANTFLGLQNTEKERAAVEQELIRTTGVFKQKEAKYAQDAKKLSGEIEALREEKAKFTKKIQDVEEKAEKQIDDLQKEIAEVTDDRDKWKRRIDAIRSDRDDLMAKISELNEKLKEAPKVKMADKEKEPAAKMVDASIAKAPSFSPDSSRAVDEEYWANLLQEKASLELDVQRLKDELSSKSITIVETKQSSEDLQFELSTLKHEKEELTNELKHKSDMIDSISLELARTKNDKKFISDRLEKLGAENGNLRRQMKQLVSVKNALEKSIVRLTQEKDKVEGQLGKTETIIQSKIDEIWEIKDDLDRSIRSKQEGTSSNEVELPPIVVSSDQATNFNTGQAPSGFNGKVISVNEANNFVIVDIGEDGGVRLGDNLSVYRDAKYIARLEVIQVRKDISAADLKDQWSKIRVGDIIR